jgi:hypothetical protein
MTKAELDTAIVDAVDTYRAAKREELMRAVEVASDNWTAAVVIALRDTADTRDAFIAAKAALDDYDKENT